MPRLDPSVVVHTSNLDKTVPPMWKPLQKKSPELWDEAAMKVGKLIKAGFVEEAKYPSWVSNIIMVRKANGSWCMCIDYTNLNRATPKDNYLLPRMETLVDRSVGKSFLSFLDAFSGYH